MECKVIPFPDQNMISDQDMLNLVGGVVSLIKNNTTAGKREQLLAHLLMLLLSA